MLRDATNSAAPGRLKTFQRRGKATGAEQPARQPPAALPEATPAAPVAPDEDEASPQSDIDALLRDSSLAGDAPGWMLRGLSCRRSSVLMPFATLLEAANYLARRKGTRKQRDERHEETRKLVENLCRQFAEIDAFELVCESPGKSPEPPRQRHRNRPSRRKHVSKPSAPKDAAGTSCPPAAAAPSPMPSTHQTAGGAPGEQHIRAPPNTSSFTLLDVGPSHPGALEDLVASTPAAASPPPPCSSPSGRRHAQVTASSVPPDPLTDTAARCWKSLEGSAEGVEPLSLLASPLSSPPPASDSTHDAGVCPRYGPLGRAFQAACSSVASGVLSSGRRSGMPLAPSQLEQQQEQARMASVGHTSGAQQLEQEEEEEEAEGLQGDNRPSLQRGIMGKVDGEGEDRAPCTDTAHAESRAVEEQATSGAASSVPSPPAPPHPDLPPLQRLLMLCGQKAPAATAPDVCATGPRRPLRPVRRRDADASGQEQQQQQEPMLQQLPSMESVLSQLREVVAAGAPGGPQEVAGADGANKGGRGKGGKAPVVKVGEGSYGEAWRLCCPRAAGRGGGSRGVVVKVVPIEGEEEFNGGPQKRAAEMLCETLVCRAVSGLADPLLVQQMPVGRPAQQAGDRGDDGPALPAAAAAGCGPCPSNSTANSTCGFVRTHAVAVCRGPYPKELVKEWERWDAAHGSENDPVGSLPPHQLYWVIAMEDGGTDLEKYPLANMDQARSVLLQVGLSLAVAEAALCFEHRDLHWGNVLVRRTREQEGQEQEGETHEQLVSFRLHGKDLKVRSCGVVSSVIDFTQSRLTAPDGSLAFTDLAADPAVFEGPEGNVQFDTYRWMRGLVGDDWSAHVPTTNCLWLAYLAEILAQQKQFGPPAGAGTGRGAGGVWRPSAAERRRLREFRLRALSYTSCSQLLEDELFSGLLVEGV